MFELRGRKAHETVSRLLQPYIDQGPAIAAAKDDTRVETTTNDSDDVYVSSALEAGELWSSGLCAIPSAAHLPDKRVIALTVKDPREVPVAVRKEEMTRSSGQTQIDEEIQSRVKSRKLFRKWPSVMSISPLWLPEVCGGETFEKV